VVLTFFRAKPGYVEKLLPVGEKRYVSGTLQMYDGIPQIVHPDRVVDEAGFAKLSGIDPVYPLTEGLALGSLRRAIAQALQKLPDLPEWISPEVIRRCSFPPIREALNRVHVPLELTDILPDGPFWSRLAFDELLAGQLALALVRAQLRRPAGDRNAGDGHLRHKIIDALPYALTSSQREAVRRHRRGSAPAGADAAAAAGRRRLRQDGGGAARRRGGRRGRQAGRADGADRNPRAPAHQDHRAAGRARRPAVAILTGREKGKERREILARLEAGEIDFLVGTHALIQDDVIFKALALAVVDEQHRFGVRERLALTNKGEAVDVLVLSATPIPRTLVLTYFGDMDVSELREKPAGRQPIETRTISMSRLDEVTDGVGRALQAGKLVYWICPLVEESKPKVPSTSPTRRSGLKSCGNASATRSVSSTADEGDRERPRDGAIRRPRDRAAGRDHGGRGRRRRPRRDHHGDRERRALRARAIAPAARPDRARLGGVDLPAALQGAARRDVEGAAEGDPRDHRRLSDCRGGSKLRGEGDVLGIRQSGLPGYRIARSDVHAQLITQARDEALRIMKDNPKLKGERGEALRCCFICIERDEACR
jgi:ATP-dependent DNA helicase RecG